MNNQTETNIIKEVTLEGDYMRDFNLFLQEKAFWPAKTKYADLSEQKKRTMRETLENILRDHNQAPLKEQYVQAYKKYLSQETNDNGILAKKPSRRLYHLSTKDTKRIESQIK